MVPLSEAAPAGDPHPIFGRSNRGLEGRNGMSLESRLQAVRPSRFRLKVGLQRGPDVRSPRLESRLQAVGWNGFRLMRLADSSVLWIKGGTVEVSAPLTHSESIA